MHGSTLTMPSIFESNPAFPRSHSSSNIPDLVNIDYKNSSIHNDTELPRSASFSTLPTIEDPSTDYDEGELHRLNSAASTPSFPAPQIVTPSPKSSSIREGKTTNRLTKEEKPKNERSGRRKSLVARPKSWIQKVKGSPEGSSAPEYANSTSDEAIPVSQTSKASREKTKSVSETFATFARKSWISSSSRSPSPSNRKSGKQIEEDGRNEGPLKTAATTLAAPSAIPAKFDHTVEDTDSPSKPPQVKRNSTLRKIRQRPQSILGNFTSLNSVNSSTSSLPGSSVDNRSTPRTSTDKVPPLPTDFSTEKLLSVETPRKRDELWQAFRGLENDYTKFLSKSLSLKTNVVRSTLLPFLRNNANHPSNRCLRPEDIDRRINIFNKWWVGLLEVLDGRANQIVSGVDRPVLLEAIVMIMTRPEWRLGPSQFSPLSERSPSRSPERTERTSIRGRKSSSSLNSSGSQFLAESVYHNVRNLFIQNLTSQMHFVVAKMSLRHAPASLVTFCGKAVAYAFFFVPGIAEILVRIWKIPTDILKRVVDELGLPKRPNKVETEEVAAAFPPHVRALGWTSVMTMTNQLREKPALSILISKIPWYGPWTARWCGRDSDLFYVFSKHYHILAEEFLPLDLSFAIKARAPGFVLVQAQILTALDATIHRQPASEPFPITFDDVLAGADASAAALPLPSTNSARLMAENRLIMLLRDFLSERPADFEPARMTFANAFGKMMQASAKRTSLYDHNACFVLCDFMDEALSLFVRFHHAHEFEDDFIDWRFWFDVCRKMLESQNSMSEIRVFAFLYSAWNLVTNNESRKEVLCLEWLLTEETFDKFFNHWCPMVRAYYMRLLCWRLCREEGEASELDTKIFGVVCSRIKGTWANYLFLKQTAESSDLLPPSTTPCLPAPGRRLLIIRNDTQMPAPSLFLGFDGLMTTNNPSNLPQKPGNAYKRHSLLGDLTQLESKENETPKLPSETTTPSKRRWTFMGRIIPSLSPSPETTSPPSTSVKAGTEKKALEEARKATSVARTRPTLNSKSSSDSETPPATASHRAYSFKFSLEWAQNFEKVHSILQTGSAPKGPAGSNSANDRKLTPPRLPAPAHAWLAARVPGMSTEVSPQDPKLTGIDRFTRSKYAGRALAEWGLIVGECNNFVDRRRTEGVPNLKWVEVPTLGVEGFRKFAG
ncbi:hypothetical protein sscle_13g093290 [Sclerotinia sclerotiorum 1980 UF-70]|uniref:DUF1765-domain-containing protein n=1 Tax=Sclerotinia sclerotiorum (strain ATCC 18683 / 1980 / Ss-1) TaxID=665079 RepID=A0A1D9QI40_SCLS1|nr:hypothetical protein sscle_13g093290 [Sclerotinia sclerotiorum 1980 UF-70]